MEAVDRWRIGGGAGGGGGGSEGEEWAPGSGGGGVRRGARRSRRRRGSRRWARSWRRCGSRTRRCSADGPSGTSPIGQSGTLAVGGWCQEGAAAIHLCHGRAAVERRLRGVHRHRQRRCGCTQSQASECGVRRRDRRILTGPTQRHGSSRRRRAAAPSTWRGTWTSCRGGGGIIDTGGEPTVRPSPRMTKMKH
ncbi:hypothetical protein DAI22_04g022100 [Oryza sativa Japonica Group]|nr:hypothetical protein DAI22_04g022100 [Oryza sativa Japonica Group]